MKTLTLLLLFSFGSLYTSPANALEKTEAQYNSEISNLERRIKRIHPEVKWVNAYTYANSIKTKKEVRS